MFWVGPILGGITGAIAYEFVFNPRRRTFASYTNAYAGRPAAYINSHILPGAYMGHMQQVRSSYILRDKMNCTVGFVSCFVSSPSLPSQHATRQQGLICQWI